jgi:uncharacterized protein Yka (UPF0111/DUF47 family)
MFKGKESEIIERLTYIAEIIVEASTILKNEFLLVKKGEETHEILIKIKSLHNKAGILREEILSLLYSEPFLPDFKESIVLLTQKLLDALNSIKDAIRSLNYRRVNEKCISIVYDSTTSYLALVEEASKKVFELVSTLLKDLDLALKIGREIQLIEREGDEIKDSILQRLYSIEREVDVISILQFRDFILSTDDVLDNFEDATLSVEMLYATLKS